MGLVVTRVKSIALLREGASVKILPLSLLCTLLYLSNGLFWHVDDTLQRRPRLFAPENIHRRAWQIGVLALPRILPP